ncbi:MAG: hypothetical protein K0S71_976 [Clostridia bacterium]|jgi:propanediol dehydratase medium subunit|nr:hypothetical protein [Clostridia bacterium]
MIRPEIVIKAYHPDQRALREVLAGIEEEGVLYKVILEEIPESETKLGHIAAEMSQIEVGIGMYFENTALYIQKIKNTPLFITKERHRIIGQNAARYVKGNPLIEI